MKNLTYEWKESGSLAAEVNKPISYVSIKFASHGMPAHITLWRPDGSGLRVHSEMHTIAERMEIGVLCFTHFKSTSRYEEMLPIDPEFNQHVDVFKLVVHESGVTAESGILLRAQNGSEITIVASAAPCMIAINGVVEWPHIFEPEYFMEDFECLPMRIGEL